MTKVPSLIIRKSLPLSNEQGGGSFAKKGSHMRVERTTESGTLKVTIPARKPIKRTTLAKLLKDEEFSVEEFIALVR